MYIKTSFQKDFPPPTLAPKIQCVSASAEGNITSLLQELRLGIEGVHIRSLNQHLDQQMIQQMLGEVLREDPPLEGPIPDLHILPTVVLSR